MPNNEEKTMHRYLISVRHYFRGEETFEVQAENREKAREAAEKHFYQTPRYFGVGNYDHTSIKVLKKLQDKGGAKKRRG